MGKMLPDPPALAAMANEDEAILVFDLPPHAAPLTRSESEVLVALVAGASNADIARARSTSERTVANQVGSLLRKLGASSRTELVAQLAVKMASSRPPRP